MLCGWLDLGAPFTLGLSHLMFVHFSGRCLAQPKYVHFQLQVYAIKSRYHWNLDLSPQLPLSKYWDLQCLVSKARLVKFPRFNMRSINNCGCRK